jgi:hypothetical protein
MTLVAVVRALQVLSALAAVVVARRRPDYHAVALFLAGMALANAARVGLREQIILPAQAALAAQGFDPLTLPLHGLARAAAHLDHALFLGWPAGLAALAVYVYLGRRPWPVAILWALTVSLVVISYPALRLYAHRQLYLAAELCALAVAVGSFVHWLWSDKPLTLPRTVTLLIIGIDCGTVFGPYRIDLFSTWNLAQAMYAVLYLALVIIQGGTLWLSSPPSKSE